MVVSVIICSHNPRENYLSRVLEALRLQTLPVSDWELLLIDNASDQRLVDRFDISWHPNGRHVREDELGLTAARLRGISEAVAKLLVFVDDDNVLDPDYLSVALRIAERYPFLGVWGGSVIPEFEVPPPQWAKPYLPYLALRDCRRDVWANLLIYNESYPNGAGMCLRRELGVLYSDAARENPAHHRMDRRGGDLTGYGDQALVFVVCRSGYSSGCMTGLRLTHLIPGERLTEGYLARLMERSEFSYVYLEFIVTGKIPSTDHATSVLRRLARWVRRLRLLRAERRIEVARIRGRREGLEEARRLATGGADDQLDSPNAVAVTVDS